MHSNLSHKVKRFLAVFLLVLLASITGVKALHTHHNEQGQHHGVTISASFASCGICEFQVARDGEVPPVFVLDIPVFHVEHPAPAPEIDFISVPRFILADRGPPVA